MNSSSPVKYYLEFQKIADYLNKILFNNPYYIDRSFMFICGMKDSKLIIDVIDIDLDILITKHKKQSVLEIMSSIANENNENIENMFKEIISEKSFPKPAYSANHI